MLFQCMYCSGHEDLARRSANRAYPNVKPWPVAKQETKPIRVHSGVTIVAKRSRLFFPKW
jgi:hypothetical protein